MTQTFRKIATIEAEQWLPDSERTAFLSAMLDGFPKVPPSYDGWFTFERRA